MVSVRLSRDMRLRFLVPLDGRSSVVDMSRLLPKLASRHISFKDCELKQCPQPARHIRTPIKRDTKPADCMSLTDGPMPKDCSNVKKTGIIKNDLPVTDGI